MTISREVKRRMFEIKEAKRVVRYQDPSHFVLALDSVEDMHTCYIAHVIIQPTTL